MQNSYYWSDEWSGEFYIELAKAGFISTTYEIDDRLILLPELQYQYALLDFENLHISKKVKKLISKDCYRLCVDKNFNEVIEKISSQHKYNWLKGEYVDLITDLHKNHDKDTNFKILSFELVDKKTENLIAGEIGYIIGKTYTSLTGFSNKDKIYNNCGTLQLVLLAKYLQKSDFEFWNLGHPYMEYKQRIGAKIYQRDKFLDRWRKAI